jgi:competence protein ComEC
MGIVAGQQNIVPDWITDDMTKSGTLHLLATSGFNVLLLAGALLFVAAHTPLPRVIQIVLVVLVLIIYADAVGGRAPVTRATVMAVVFFSAVFFGRTSDGLSAMALAAIGTALFEPWSILDAGYQLSFMVVFGLMLYAPPAFRKVQSFVGKRRWPGPIKVVAIGIGTSLSTTLVAMLFASPILSSRFGTFSLVAPIANLITAAAVPFVYLGVAVGSIGELFSSSVGRGADLLITGPSSAAIIRANHSLAAWQGSSVSDLYLPVWAMVCVYVVLFGLSRQQKPVELLDEEF